VATPQLDFPVVRIVTRLGEFSATFKPQSEENWKENLTTHCLNFRKTKSPASGIEKDPADSVAQGLLHGNPQKYTIIKIVVGSFGLYSVLTEGSALDSC